MKTLYSLPGLKMVFMCLVVALAAGSCRKFVTLDDPKGQLTLNNVFSENGSATAAVVALYGSYIDYTLPELNKYGGLVSDELVTDDASLARFMNNSISPEVPGDTWAQEYSIIRSCNLAIDGLTSSSSLDDKIKDQLLGEALFMRAFGFFNLVNLFGDVPITLSPKGSDNAQLPRANSAEVWKQIFSDLKTAKSLVGGQYVSSQRTRVNKAAVSALLARAYLYQENWEMAETEASEVIDNGIYFLEGSDAAFLPDSRETILQIYIQEGVNPSVFDFLPPVPDTRPAVYLRDGFVNAFEPGDMRMTSWVGLSDGIYYVQKYKNQDYSSVEYAVLFRLSELYLIRAEARVHLHNLNGGGSAASDLNKIRENAGLSGRELASQAIALKAIEQERKVELFGEYPHRWFDLRRWAGFTDPTLTRADEVLSLVKGSFWQPTDKFFPISEADLRLNKNLIQNEGY